MGEDGLIMKMDELLWVGGVDKMLVCCRMGGKKVVVGGEVICGMMKGRDELVGEVGEMGVGVYGRGGESGDVGELVGRIIVESRVSWGMKGGDVMENGK